MAKKAPLKWMFASMIHHCGDRRMLLFLSQYQDQEKVFWFVCHFVRLEAKQAPLKWVFASITVTIWRCLYSTLLVFSVTKNIWSISCCSEYDENNDNIANCEPKEKIKTEMKCTSICGISSSLFFLVKNFLFIFHFRGFWTLQCDHFFNAHHKPAQANA